MTARTPEEVHSSYEEAFNAGDIDALVSLYEPGATFFAQPGPAMTGHTAIREILRQFLVMKPRLEMAPAKVLSSGDLALLFSKWTMNAVGSDGESIALQGETTDVVRQQPNGDWLLAIDNPFGLDWI
jgi:uncharacterized protein (TIGR02246 family)